MQMVETTTDHRWRTRDWAGFSRRQANEISGNVTLHLLLSDQDADRQRPEQTRNFHATAHSKNGTLHSPPIGDPEFMGGGKVILELFRKMVRTGKPVIPYESILEKIAIVDAALLSQKRGKAVRLSEILG